MSDIVGVVVGACIAGASGLLGVAISGRVARRAAEDEHRRQLEAEQRVHRRDVYLRFARLLARLEASTDPVTREELGHVDGDELIETMSALHVVASDELRDLIQPLALGSPAMPAADVLQLCERAMEQIRSELNGDCGLFAD